MLRPLQQLQSVYPLVRTNLIHPLGNWG